MLTCEKKQHVQRLHDPPEVGRVRCGTRTPRAGWNLGCVSICMSLWGRVSRRKQVSRHSKCFICQTKESVLFPVGTGKTSKDIKQGDSRIRNEV